MKLIWETVEPGWHHCREIGSIRTAENYGKSGGWWFLAAWFPDDEKHDVGPFRTLQLAKAAAERMYEKHVTEAGRSALRKEERG